MNMYIFITLSVIFCFSGQEMFANNLISATKEQYSIASSLQAEESLLRAFNDMEFDVGQDRLLLFIHGRGKHPQKLFTNKLLSSLQNSYKVKVLAFHWSPSWDGPLGWEKPKRGAVASAEKLLFVLQALQKYQSKHQQLNVSLLTHSMGSLVLQSFIEKYPRTISSLFKNVVISASASPLKKHADWVNDLQMQQQLYITINNNDSILAVAGSSLFSARLGKKLRKFFGGYETLSDNSIYIDVSDLGVNHRYYIGSKNHLHNFYSLVLSGKSVDLNPHNGFEKQMDKPIYKVKN
ncbi:alpha/beta hydrolase [Candidatus Uabimicrobium sp. HlEnr_7]|uniref:alpha/beta hydrolase n=1 Tax=Candidatus Uabimicrobium helgolandensis TaxID=3095367 RepID=UPI0035581168